MSMTTPRVTVPVEDLAGKLKAIRDKFLMPTPDKDFTDYAIMTRCVEALSAAPAPEGGAVSERLAEIATWTDEEWETVFAHRPDLRDRMRDALASGSGDHAELEGAAKRLADIELSDGGCGYCDALMDVYGHQPARQFYIDARSLLAEIAALRADVDRLKLAICGGEDVPGAIAAVTVEDCERFCRENHASRGDFIDRATEAERKLAEAEEENGDMKERLSFATQLLRDYVDLTDVSALSSETRDFLSKEAERG